METDPPASYSALRMKRPGYDWMLHVNRELDIYNGMGEFNELFAMEHLQTNYVSMFSNYFLLYSKYISLCFQMIYLTCLQI